MPIGQPNWVAQLGSRPPDIIIQRENNVDHGRSPLHGSQAVVERTKAFVQFFARSARPGGRPNSILPHAPGLSSTFTCCNNTSSTIYASWLHSSIFNILLDISVLLDISILLDISFNTLQPQPSVRRQMTTNYRRVASDKKPQPPLRRAASSKKPQGPPRFQHSGRLGQSRSTPRPRPAWACSEKATASQHRARCSI